MKLADHYTDRKSAQNDGRNIKRTARVPFDAPYGVSWKTFSFGSLWELCITCPEGTVIDCDCCGTQIVQRKESGLQTLCCDQCRMEKSNE